MKTNSRTAIFAVSKAMAQAFLLVLVMVLPVVTSYADQVAEKPKRVLLLCSEQSNLPTQALVERAIRSTLKNGSPVPLDVYSEYLDFMRIPVNDYEKELVSLLRRKYEGRKFDLIIALQPTSLGVLLRHQPEVFPDTPIVFEVLDQRYVAGLALGPNVTGVWGELDFKPNLDLALALHPNTRKVVVLVGVSEFDKYWTARVKEDFLAYEGKLEITYLIGRTIAEQQQALASLPQHTIVFFVTATRDNAGNNYNNPDVLRQISSASIAPIYGTTDGQLGMGIVGGSILSFEALGVRAAELGLRVLAGEKPQAIAPHGVPNVIMFDWRELRRWGIDESRLPSGSIVRYRELSVWELYKWRIIGAISIIVLQALGIVWLLFTHAKRRQAEKRSARFALLAESERQHLDKIVANVPGIVWEATLEAGDPVPKTTFISPYLGKMLGYSAEEWLGAPGFVQSLILEEDREEANREIAAILEHGKEGVVRSRWVAKDGRVLWVETHLAATRLVTGKTVGLLGVTLDISEPKRHEEALQQLTGRLLMLQDEERRRVAGELHDGLGQNLAIIKNRAMIGLRDQANQERVLEQLEEIASTATASILEVREIAHNLRPYELDRLGLVAAIESMIERVADSTSINLSAALESIEGLLSPETETSAYRIVQEGLNNVVKHSHATTARIEIKRSGKQLVISVQDNGKGIPPSAPAGNGDNSGGFGLAGIAERVRVLHGTFVIDSEPSRGTTLTVRLELQNGRAE
jgi:PAS domain S-box-containing protein